MDESTWLTDLDDFLQSWAKESYAQKSRTKSQRASLKHVALKSAGQGAGVEHLGPTAVALTRIIWMKRCIGLNKPLYKDTYLVTRYGSIGTARVDPMKSDSAGTFPIIFVRAEVRNRR
jgi:hypothetical protein